MRVHLARLDDPQLDLGAGSPSRFPRRGVVDDQYARLAAANVRARGQHAVFKAKRRLRRGRL